MSPTGLRRTVAIVLILSPWVFIPGLFKDIVFILIGVLLFLSTFDIRRARTPHPTHQETESIPSSLPQSANLA